MHPHTRHFVHRKSFALLAALLLSAAFAFPLTAEISPDTSLSPAEPTAPADPMAEMARSMGMEMDMSGMTRTEQAIAMRMCYIPKSDDALYVKLSRALGAAPCTDGFAGDFPCQEVDLLSAVPLQDLGATRGSDIWGWTDPETGQEIAIYNTREKTVFLDITDPRNPVHVGDLPVPGLLPAQGDVKVYGNHAYIVGERATDFGLQVFDMRRLRGVTDPPETFDVDAHYQGFGRAHNLAINEESGFAYGVSTTTCADGLHVVDLSSPEDPQFAGCVDQVGFIHDTQCVMYHGPDPNYQGREICINSGGDSLSITDVTDKSAPRVLARTDYPGRVYVHQGWLTEDQAYFLLDDEGDEIESGNNTRTYIWDFADLDNPRFIGHHSSTSSAADHNLYIVGDYVFEANYAAGLRILRLDDLAAGEMTEVGYFDVVPSGDGAQFGGAWTAYPFFESGNVVISTLSQGVFIVRPSFDYQNGSNSCGLELGDPNYCQQCGPCSAAEGSCKSDDDCRGELICAEDFGPAFNMGPNVDVCVAPRSVDLGYEPTALDSLGSGANPLGRIRATAINDRGQVTGWADSGDGTARRAFRFTPGTGMESLGPEGESTEGLAINDAGFVFGRLVRPRANGSVRQTGFFLDRPDTGFDRLGRGSTNALRTSFELLDMNASGDLVGVLRRNRAPRLLPYLFTAEDGWLSLASLDARLRERSTLPIAINDAADILFSTEALPSGAQDAYLLRGGAELLRLGNLGRRVNAPLDLNEKSWIVGYSETAERRGHAYFVKPGKALIDLHRGRFTSSFAGWVTARGVVGGVFDEEALFTYDARRTQKVQVVAARGAFAGLLPAGATFERIEVEDMNQRLEFIGRVLGRAEDGERVVRFFYFSPAAGLADLADVLGETGTTAGILSVKGLSDRGALLLQLGGEGGAVVLSPR